MNSTVVAALVILLCACSAQSAFVHPGVMVNKAQLDWIKLQVQQKIDPVWTAFVNANKTTIASPTYKPRGPPASGVIECGYYSNPDFGCSDDGTDSSAAYAQALFYYITGNKVYANNSIAIFNNYAYGLRLINSTFNGPLQAGWSTAKFLKGAEILRHSNSGWSDADFTAYTNMLYKVYVPLIYAGSGANGNWELTMIDGLLGIAVLTENQTMFDHAVTQWRQRLPAYFYNYNIDGNKNVPAPRGKPTWYGNTVFNQSTSGLCQETCRDLGHTQMGLNSAINAAETAYIQGVDLYSEQQERITTALEFHADILLNRTMPDYLCNFTALVGTTSYTATFETAYSAYATRKGIPLNSTLTHILTHVRKITNQSNKLTNVFETLTSSSLAPAFTTTSSAASSTTKVSSSTSTTAKASTTASATSTTTAKSSTGATTTAKSSTSASVTSATPATDLTSTTDAGTGPTSPPTENSSVAESGTVEIGISVILIMLGLVCAL